ncbi:methylmalonyl-CoA mutase [Streptomyces laculatispora]|uniref:Methylmalonyl-CoA mutase n=1 Tax=Streptomyces laculatispora TaxID=887464 RepID=A0ABY9HZV0_9ACTN|nr:cobalamin-dependent protein [Streptomyces laculatispora]MBO0913745.1 methylmalonyl-CoA mutase [Streptomyces laculatispora]WLQ40118.1 methylmalonyl-CoA mutase [Streptomyces laculatispora]
MSESDPIRVVMAKPEAGGKGAAAPPTLVEAFTGAGLEVIQAGDDQSPVGLVDTVVREGAAVICISSLLGDHEALFGGVLDLLAERGAGKVTVIGGGIIPTNDVTGLKARGVAEIFSSGTPAWAAAEWVRDHVRQSSGV